MKKYILIPLAAAMILSITACTGNSKENSTETKEIIASSEETAEGTGENGSSSDDSDTAAGLTGEFKSFTAEDLDGNTVTQDILTGYDLTIMNVWGTFCSPCIREMPYLGELSMEYADKGVQIIGVVIDARNRDGSFSPSILAEAEDIIGKTGADYLHLLPSDDLMDIHLNTVTSIPYTIFIDKNGSIIDTVIGSMEKDQWIEAIDAVLEEVK